MPSKKVITVIGATGAQGGSVVSTFLDDPKLNKEWAVCAVTQDTSKESALYLADKGAVVVYGDLNDKASLIRALDGSYAVFGVTNYWEKMDADLEVQQGKNLVEAVKAIGVKHFIWSSLPNVAELSRGKFQNVYHFDSKAKVEEYARKLGVPATYFMAGFYMMGIPGQMFKGRGPGSQWTFALPIGPGTLLPVFHPRDTGKYVKAIVLNADKLLGQRVLGARTYMTPQDIVDDFEEVFPVTSATARYLEVSEDTFHLILKSQGLPDFAITEVYESLKQMEEFGYFGDASLHESHEFLEDSLTTWKEYAREAPTFEGFT
ncbi:hypothetical protein M426DRAFT_112958 [Hypoxylon sp. CI-4A]|nr:hypothetical protein M426DRAFT_112958 [Hypoxylon sp. CI-4A]